MSEQFSDKDRAFIDDAIRATDAPYAENITLKRFTGVSDPGDPARGIQPKLGFSLTCIRGIVNSIKRSVVVALM